MKLEQEKILSRARWTRAVQVTATHLVSVALVTATSFVANAQAIAGCTDSSFEVGGQQVNIATLGAAYSPKCLRVKVGTQITIQANSRHPLSAMPDINGVKNPFSDRNSFTSPQTRIMAAVGAFGYFCDAHGDSEGDGMAGLIVVEE